MTYGVELNYIPKEINWVHQNEWRWNRVLELVNTKDAIPSPPGDDKWIVGAYKFMMAMRATKGDRAAQRSCSKRWPALYSAYTLRTTANNILRDGINALLGLGTSTNEIASQFNESNEAVVWYMKLWWSDCDPKSDRPFSALYNSAVQNPDALSTTFSANNSAAYYLMLGYGYNPNVLWDTLENRELPDEGHKRFASAYNSTVARKSLAAVASVTPNSFNAVDIMGHYLDSLKTKQDMAIQDRVQGGAMADLLNYCINGARWAIMNRSNIPSDLHQLEPKKIPNRKLLTSELENE